MDKHTPPWEGSPEPDCHQGEAWHELLSAYADNECSPAERKEVETHLQTCAACREWLAQAQADQQLFTDTLMGRQADLTDAVLRSVSEMSAPEKEVVAPRRAFGRWAEVFALTAMAAIMAAILFPTFATSREKARQTSCMANLKGIALGLLEYAADNGDRLPPADGWTAATLPYTKNTQIFVCPQAWEGGHTGYALVARWAGTKLSNMPDPANTILLYEVENGQPVYRHNGGMNVGYADGHVKWLRKLPPDVAPGTGLSTAPVSRNWGLPRGAKLAYGATCEVWVKNLQQAALTAESAFYEHGGFVLSSLIQQLPGPEGARNAQVTGKVPTAEVAATVNALTALGYVVRREISGQDLSDEYVQAERSVTQVQQETARLEQGAATAPRRQRPALAAQARVLRQKLGPAQDELFAVKREVALATITATLIEKAPEAGLAVGALAPAWRSFTHTARLIGVALVWAGLYGLFAVPVGVAVWLWRRRR